MAGKPQNIIEKLTQHQFSQVKLGALITNLSHLVPPTAKLLQINVDRYKQVPVVGSALTKTTALDQVWQTISEIFPTFPFTISSQLKSNAKLVEVGHQLMIASIGSMGTHYSFQKSHTIFFLKQIDLSVDIADAAMNQPKADALTYLPKLVHGDLHLIANGIDWPASGKSHDIIEHHYCLLGISQIFLRYFYDLLCGADSDEKALHIDQVFNNFFVGLGARETQYWQKYKNAEKLKNQLHYIIDKDSVTTRHPFLRKPFFDQLHTINPIIHDGGRRGMTMSMQNVLKDQLDAFHSLSLTKLSLFLKLVATTKGLNYGQYLVVQLAQNNQERLHELDNFLSTGNVVQSIEIVNLLQPFLKKPPKAKTVFQDEQTTRQKNAVKNLEKRANIAAYTSDQLGQYFKNYLNKLYDRVRKEGALTQDGIKEYLARFKQDMMEIARKAVVTIEEKEVFEESIDSTLDALTGGHLSEEEVMEYKNDIHDELSDFVSITPLQREEKVVYIENAISAAVDLSQIKEKATYEEQLYKKALPLELQINVAPNYVITVEQFLEQPISQKEKIQFLHSFVPNPISAETHTAIKNVQFRCGLSSSNPVPIYNGTKLLKKGLIRLIFPQHPFKELLQRKIIPILPEQGSPKISVRDFFTFPFAEKRKGPKADAWFEQHLFYLGMAVEEGSIDDEDRQVLIENLDSFPILEYKKYFNIVRKKKFEDTMFMAVYSLWQNNGLDKMRISSDE